MDLSIILIFLLVVAMAIILITICYKPTSALIPINYLIYTFNRNQPVYTEEEKRKIFPMDEQYISRWKYIRNEAWNCYPDTKEHFGKNLFSVGDEFWNGWTAFPLRINGFDILENQKLCPVTSELLKNSPNVPTAFFSVLAPGKTLYPHYGPYAGILRYHLGLDIPENNPPCTMTVSGIDMHWKNGKSLLFDETYLHSATNPSDKPRIILYLDIIKPMDSVFVDIPNQLVLLGIKYSPHTYYSIHNEPVINITSNTQPIVPSLFILIIITILAWTLSEFAVYIWHRWLAHNDVFDMLRSTHRKHHRADSTDQAHEDFIWSLLILFIFCVFTIVFYIFYVINKEIAILFVFLATCFVLINWYIHAAYHDSQHWLQNHQWFQKMKQEHFVHHIDTQANYGIVTRVFDKLFGTFKYPSSYQSEIKSFSVDEN